MDYKFKCEFIDIYNEKCKVFQNRQEFYNDKEIYFPKRITLTPKYKDHDLLYPQGADVFFSKEFLTLLLLKILLVMT